MLSEALQKGQGAKVEGVAGHAESSSFTTLFPCLLGYAMQFLNLPSFPSLPMYAPHLLLFLFFLIRLCLWELVNNSLHHLLTTCCCISDNFQILSGFM